MTYIMQTAETIRLQLLATTPANTLLIGAFSIYKTEAIRKRRMN